MGAVSKITIIGIDAHGNQQCETIEILEPNKRVFTSHRYKQLSAPEPGLHFVARPTGWWRRMAYFFGFGRWRIVRVKHDA